MRYNPALERKRLRDVEYLRDACTRLGIEPMRATAPASSSSRSTRRRQSRACKGRPFVTGIRRKCLRSRAVTIATRPLRTASS